MAQEYANYTIDLKLGSPLATPLQSDTIFGHICWAVRYLQWEVEEKLIDFLGKFKDNEAPPLLISNGFPEGYLPKPILPPVEQDVLDELFTINERVKNSYLIKSIKEAERIPFEVFKRLQAGIINPRLLLEEMKCCVEQMSNEGTVSTVSVQHNTIDRVKGRARDGGLFSQNETFFSEDARRFTVYLKTNYFSKAELQRLFGFISKSGYGRDKSTGKGYFTFEIQEGIGLPEAKEPKAFMTLSSFVPTEKDPTDGYYNIVQKYGKLGGSFAKGVSEVYDNPFKVPLIMFSAGSVFRDKDYKPGKFYGSLLKKVHQNEDIRHYAYAFPIGINIEVENEDI